MSQEVYELQTGLKKIGVEVKRMTGKTLGPVLVGVAGGSGSGKTKKVAREINKMFLNSQVLSMDDYYRGQDFMDSIYSNNWDDPRAVELSLLAEHLKMIKQGKTIQKPFYCRNDGRRHGYETFTPKDIVIVEGLFALWPSIVEKVDLKIFVDVSIHGSLIRRILRDVGHTGQTEEDILSQYVETVYPMFRQHVEPTKKAADIIILNQYVPEIEAAICESREIQLKAEIYTEIPKEKLKEFGFEVIEATFQEDTYYTAPEWQDNYTEELMRIRCENKRYFLAYKGPEEGSSLRVRPKIEFEVEPLAKEGLEKLGYKEALCLKKRRERFLGRGLELMIDRFGNGRVFAELRTVDPSRENEIFACLKDFGAIEKTITKKSYLEIMK
jgi:uridine kinase